MELKKTNYAVTAKELKTFLKNFTDDTEIDFIMMDGEESLGHGAQKIEFYSPEFNSVEEDEDWADENCEGEWHPRAYFFVIS